MGISNISQPFSTLPTINEQASEEQSSMQKTASRVSDLVQRIRPANSTWSMRDAEEGVQSLEGAEPKKLPPMSLTRLRAREISRAASCPRNKYEALTLLLKIGSYPPDLKAKLIQQWKEAKQEQDALYAACSKLPQIKVLSAPPKDLFAEFEEFHPNAVRSPK